MGTAFQPGFCQTNSCSISQLVTGDKMYFLNQLADSPTEQRSLGRLFTKKKKKYNQELGVNKAKEIINSWKYSSKTWERHTRVSRSHHTLGRTPVTHSRQTRKIIYMFSQCTCIYFQYTYPVYIYVYICKVYMLYIKTSIYTYMCVYI